MPWSTWKRLGTFFFLPAVNAHLLLATLKACDWSRHIFGASASPSSATSKNWLCHPFQLFMEVSMIPNTSKKVTFELFLVQYCMRHSWLTKFGGLCLNQLARNSPSPVDRGLCPEKCLYTSYIVGRDVFYCRRSGNKLSG